MATPEQIEVVVTRAMEMHRPIIITSRAGIVAYAGPPSWRLIRFDPPLHGRDALRALIEVSTVRREREAK
jgi:hypothetical protein